MSLNLGTILQAGAAEHPDSPALRLGDFSLSYRELDAAARGVATSLQERGVEHNDTVAVLIPNVPEFTISYFGILYAGATVVPLNVHPCPAAHRIRPLAYVSRRWPRHRPPTM